MQTVSFYISNTSIKAVSAVTGRKKSTIHKACRRNIPEGLIINGIITDENALCRELKQFCHENSLHTDNSILTISGKNIMSKIVNVPQTGSRNILKLIKNEFSDVENIQNYVFDYTVINPSNPDNTASLLACAADSDTIKSYDELFKNAGIKIKSMNIAVNAAVKLMRNFSGTEKTTCLLAVMDGNTLSPYLFTDGIFNFSNTSRLIQERGTEALINETAGIISSFIQFSKTLRNQSDISDVYFCGMNEQESRMCSRISGMLGINAAVLPRCCQDIVSYPDNFRISEYIYNTGNLMKP